MVQLSITFDVGNAPEPSPTAIFERCPLSVICGFAKATLRICQIPRTLVMSSPSPTSLPSYLSTSRGVNRAEAVDANAFARFMKAVTRQRTVENHPLNARLVFEELFLGYREMFA